MHSENWPLCNYMLCGLFTPLVSQYATSALKHTRNHVRAALDFSGENAALSRQLSHVVTMPNRTRSTYRDVFYGNRLWSYSIGQSCLPTAAVNITT